MRKDAVIDGLSVALRVGIALILFGVIVAAVVLALMMLGWWSLPQPYGTSRAFYPQAVVIAFGVGLTPMLGGAAIAFTAWFSRLLVARMSFRSQ